jgi:MFS family permease
VRRTLALATVAVAFAAADTYVVVLALPDMMISVGLSIDELQRAAPIVSGFLLGYVAVLPLIGRIADLRGRVPVLTASLLVFALGSLVTALSADLPTMVTGRFLQGVGGGGLVPATLALVADLYPADRRSVPLGLVSGVQELGSVLGPLYGALVLALADWQVIFWVNLGLGLLLAAALAASARRRPGPRPGPRPGRGPDLPGLDLPSLVLLVLTLAGTVLLLARPASLTTDVVLGWPFVPLAGGGLWLAPLTILTAVLAALLVLRCLVAARPLVDLRGWGRTLVAADLPGALLLGLALACVIVAFATADPAVQVFSPAGEWLLLAAAGLAGGFVLHLRRACRPLVPRRALRRTPAWGSLLVSFFVGAALIAALVDIPVYARLTSYPDSQLGAALVLVRLLVALPVGAVAGGYLARHLPAGPVCLVGMLAAAGGFTWMSRWGLHSLEHPVATVPLVAAGLGFGLALAPVNTALLGATDATVHGLAGALAVVARMVGMLVAVSVLTGVGLHRYFAAQAALPSMADVCGAGRACPRYRELVDLAALTQVHTIFAGAAVCALLAGLLAALLLRGAPTRS